jgi:hypothetical protein
MDNVYEALYQVIEKTKQINELKYNNIDYYTELEDLHQNYLSNFINATKIRANNTNRLYITNTFLNNI